jgi:hypothetical protein
MDHLGCDQGAVLNQLLGIVGGENAIESEM